MKIKYSSIAILLALLFTSCEQKETIEPGTFVSNQTAALYLVTPPTQKMVDYSFVSSTSLTKDDMKATKEVKYCAGLFKETAQKMDVKVQYDENKVALYNKAFNTNYSAFPANLLDYNATLPIDSGNIKSKVGVLKIKNAKELSLGTSYLIPLSIVAEGTSYDVLTAAQTLYVKVDVTEDLIKKSVIITRSNYFKINKDESNISNIGNVFTMEGLIYVDKFHDAEDPGEAGISTFMGTEGKTLLRFGDSGIPGNHLQAAGTDIKIDFKTKQWYHIALVNNKGNCTVYVNGKKVTSYPGSSNALGEFFIGRSYNAGRGIQGRLSEIRLWNVVRSEKEIVNNMYKVKPDTKGLYAYWKMNSAENNNQIPDISGNNRTLEYVTQKNAAPSPIKIQEEDGIVVGK